MAEDILDGGTPRTPPADPPRNRRIVCEFCDCELGADGSYKKLSDKAKAFRDSEETIETLQETIVARDQEIVALKARQPAPVAEPQGARSGGITL